MAAFRAIKNCFHHQAAADKKAHQFDTVSVTGADMSEKDEVFWKALMENNKKEGKKKAKKKPLTNADELASRYGITRQEVERVYELFLCIDDDSSGSINASEIAKGLMGFGYDVSPKTVQAVMRASDVNGDGEINFEEFLAAVVSKVKLKNSKADIHIMFEKFDKNGDGVLSAEELVVAWRETLKTKITVKEARALIQQADSSGSGTVTYDQFITMCQTI